MRHKSIWPEISEATADEHQRNALFPSPVPQLRFLPQSRNPGKTFTARDPDSRCSPAMPSGRIAVCRLAKRPSESRRRCCATASLGRRTVHQTLKSMATHEAISFETRSGRRRNGRDCGRGSTDGHEPAASLFVRSAGGNVLIVGDPFQLRPSHGALRDMIAAGTRRSAHRNQTQRRANCHMQRDQDGKSRAPRSDEAAGQNLVKAASAASGSNYELAARLNSRASSYLGRTGLVAMNDRGK